MGTVCRKELQDWIALFCMITIVLTIIGFKIDCHIESIKYWMGIIDWITMYHYLFIAVIFRANTSLLLILLLV